MIGVSGPHRGSQSLTTLPPRLFASSPLGVIANALSLVLAALVGAGIVHLLAHHVPLEATSAGRWMADAGALLGQCPLIFPLCGLGGGAVAAALLVVRETSRLRRLDDRLARLASTRPHPKPAVENAVSTRSPVRLGFFVVCLFALQIPVLLLLETAWTMPMSMTMPMRGALLATQGPGFLVFGVLHLLIATLIGLLLWRVERRLTCLRARVAYHLARLTHAATAAATHPVACRSLRPLSARYGPVLFARPPPLMS